MPARPAAAPRTIVSPLARPVRLGSTDADGRKGVSYVGVVPLLTEAVKQQSRRVEALQAENVAQRNEIRELKARLDALESRLVERR